MNDEPRGAAWWRTLLSRPWLTFAIVAVVFFSGALLWQRWSLWNKIAAEEARVRAAGQPLSAEEFARYVANGPNHNARLDKIYDEALAIIRSNVFRLGLPDMPVLGSGGDPPQVGQPWNEMAAVDAFLSANDRVLRLLWSAADEPGTSTESAPPISTNPLGIDRTSSFRTLTNLLHLDCALAAHQGDATRAARDILGIIKLGDSMRDEASVVHLCVRVAIQGVAAKLVREYLPPIPFSDGDLERMGHAFAAGDCLEMLPRVIAGERCWQISALDSQEWAREKRTWLAYYFCRDANKLLILENNARQMAAFERAVASHSLLGLHEELERGHANALHSLNARQDDFRFAIAQTLSSSPVILSLSVVVHNDQAVMAQTRVAIAIERFRRRTRRLPDRLDELVGHELAAVPLDPWDDEPLRYRRTDDELLIYSIGQNLVDDGGESQSEWPNSSQPDFVYRLKLPLGRWENNEIEVQ